ncbi:hypothetical protein PAXRUDRAFT_171004 [Paxillus rubicundulus Ve08.2h10]|uniref:Uncharacterized protein n=1 Tax=Paxillus rubicundulus Ve08.2h10 TaxID=930991 RepID=A0A0D0CLF2_9AGAM|nr:hypothetical protein PAXRUDRAFT_171004 [Paxillus rubicundulus Ve08.2h10]
MYYKWCKAKKFESKLAADIKSWNTATAVANAKQGSLDDHVREIEPGKHVVPYSNKHFREAAVEWLISTNQPLQAVDHPSFKKMIYIASQATKGVVIPNHKVTCAEIIDLLKTQMMKLREHLNVSTVSQVVACDVPKF